MKHIRFMKSKVAVLILAAIFYLGNSFAQTTRDSVTISGTVTDYNGQPIDSCSIFWQNPSFGEVRQALTDRDGKYIARIPSGKYQSMAAVKLSAYPHTAKPGLSEADQRLEFWAWDFIADRDTTVDIRYHRMEAYGLRVFRIPGAMPAYQIYVRPMSLTRFLQESSTGAVEHAQHVADVEQEAVTEQAKAILFAPPADKLKVVVRIDGEEVPVLMKQEIKEYFQADQWGNAYLLTVDRPEKATSNLPYRVFKVELTDLENGDRGEGLYYMEKEDYVK